MIDFDALSMLIGPRWRNREDNSRERLYAAVIRKRCGSKKGKNHGTGKRNAAIRRKRK